MLIESEATEFEAGTQPIASTMVLPQTLSAEGAVPLSAKTHAVPVISTTPTARTRLVTLEEKIRPASIVFSGTVTMTSTASGRPVLGPEVGGLLTVMTVVPPTVRPFRAASASAVLVTELVPLRRAQAAPIAAASAAV